MFKFLADHNVPKAVSDFLRKQQYDVKLVKDVHSGITDLQVVSWAKAEGRIIISNDKDFIGLSAKYPEVDMILFEEPLKNVPSTAILPFRLQNVQSSSTYLI